MIWRLARYLKAEWRKYSVVCGLGLIVAALEMIPPKMVGMTVERLRLTPENAGQAIVTTALSWILIAFTVQICHGIQIHFASRAGETILSRLREQLFGHLQKLSMSYFDKTQTGKIISSASNDIDALRNVLSWGLNTLMANVALMFLSSCMIYRTDPTLFFATVWLAPTMTLLNSFYGRRVTDAWITVRKHSSKVGANQAENILGARVVAAFNRQDANLRHYNNLQKRNTLNNVWASKVSGLFNPMLQLVRFAGIFILLSYGGYLVSLQKLKPGNLVSVVFYWEWFMQPAASFGVFLNDILASLSGAERIFSILDEKIEVKDREGALPLPALEGRVRFNHVTFSYRPGRPVLKNLSFDVAPGTTVALVGETGSGKSTVVSLIARFYEPQEGQVLIDDHDISLFTAESLHRQVAVVLQNNFLFSGTVLENLRYGRPSATDEEVFAAAKALGCHGRFLALRDGYNTCIRENGASLSQGERQLVCFTRAMVAAPRVLLLDEATSAFDPLTGFHVQNALYRLMENRTTFIVTHRVSTALQADVVMVLENGELIEAGAPEELLACSGKFSALHSDSVFAKTSHARLNTL